MAFNKYIELVRLAGRMLRNRQFTPRKALNAAHNTWSAVLRRPVAGQAPSAVIIEPVNFCNLKCAGCGFAMCGQIQKPEALSFERFKTVFDDVKDDLLFLVLENAGEPFLNKELLRMVKYAFDQRVPTITSTNADFPTPEDWGQQVVQSRLDTLIVSISGHDNESHARYHRKGHFDRVVANLLKVREAKRKLNASNPDLILRFIETRDNQASVETIRRRCREWGIRKLDVRATEIEQFAYRRSPDGRVRIKIHGEMPLHYPNFCPTLYYIPDILVDGSVFPCCFTYLFPPRLGNVLNDGGLRAVWNNPQYQEMRRRVARERMSIPACTACGGGLGYQGGNWNRPARFEIFTPYHEEPRSTEGDAAGGTGTEGRGGHSSAPWPEDQDRA